MSPPTENVSSATGAIQRAAEDNMPDYLPDSVESKTQSQPVEPSTVALVHNAAAGHMNTALQIKCNEIQKLWVEADQHDVLARYPIAVHCREVRDGGGYGTGAVNKLANYLGRNPSTVHDYAKVAEFWPDEQQFRNTVMGVGKCLSLSHVVELTREEDADRRQRLMAQALHESWSVKRLAKERRASPGKETDSSSPASKPSLVWTAIAEGVGKQLAGLKVTWEKELPRQIEKAEPEELPTARDRLSQSRQDFDDFHRAGVESLDRCIVQIEERLKLETSKVDQQRA